VSASKDGFINALVMMRLPIAVPRLAQCTLTLPILNQQSIHISNRLEQPSLLLIENWPFSMKLQLEPRRGLWLEVCHIYLLIDRREVELFTFLYSFITVMINNVYFDSGTICTNFVWCWHQRHVILLAK